MFAPAAASLLSTWYTGASSIDITLKAHIYRPFSAAGFCFISVWIETYNRRVLNLPFGKSLHCFYSRRIYFK